MMKPSLCVNKNGEQCLYLPHNICNKLICICNAVFDIKYQTLHCICKLAYFANGSATLSSNQIYKGLLEPHYLCNMFAPRISNYDLHGANRLRAVAVPFLNPFLFVSPSEFPVDLQQIDVSSLTTQKRTRVSCLGHEAAERATKSQDFRM